MIQIADLFFHQIWIATEISLFGDFKDLIQQSTISSLSYD